MVAPIFFFDPLILLDPRDVNFYLLVEIPVGTIPFGASDGRESQGYSPLHGDIVLIDILAT
jgi:hypothetical protein